MPPWQRSLDAVLLTTARPDHLKGLLDIVKRYSIKEVIDSGMLHPSATYALWRRTISERNFSYLAASRGTGIDIGAFVSLQVLWPVRPLHKGSDEARDNGLIVRVVTPGMRLLLLGASAQSRYALAGLLNNSGVSYLQADVVQVVEGGGANVGLNTVLQEARSGLLIVTPASSKKGKGAQVTQPSALLKNEALQIVQTAQVGTVELTSNRAGWNMTIDGQ